MTHKQVAIAVAEKSGRRAFMRPTPAKSLRFQR
jgi:hypothetical protein